MPVTMPMSAAGSGPRPYSSALSAPVTQNSASPNASKTLTSALHPAERRVEDEREQAGDHRHHQVAPVLQRGRRGGADQDVAQEPAAEARRTGQDQHPEDVEALADRDQGAGDREDEDADQVEHDQGGGRLGLHVGDVTLPGRAACGSRAPGRAAGVGSAHRTNHAGAGAGQTDGAPHARGTER